MSDDELVALEVSAGLTASAPPPDGLRGELLAAALARRAAGRPVGAADACSPAAAFRGAADDLLALLRELTPSEWEVAAHPDYGPVRALVAHLVGVEELVLGWLGARPLADRLAPTEHLAATRAAVGALAGDDPRSIADRWHALTHEVEAAARAADPALPIVAHDLPTDPSGLLVLRAFELFAHTEDVAAAVGRPSPPTDASRLALMSQRLMDGLPFALALRGASRPGRTARLVLIGDDRTGPAGGTYDVPLDPATGAGPPEVTITVDVREVCLLAAHRRTPLTVGAVVDGDRDLAEALLASADAFARD